MSWYQSRLDELSLEDVAKDPKTLLQEFLQAKKLPLPNYEVVEINGAAHEQLFTVSCSVSLLSDIVAAEASSRRQAEKLAAEKV